MKYITKYKSPNYNLRNNSKIQLIIIHYTALKNTFDAISYLCNKEKKVSSHYLIKNNGGIIGERACSLPLNSKRFSTSIPNIDTKNIPNNKSGRKVCLKNFISFLFKKENKKTTKK